MEVLDSCRVARSRDVTHACTLFLNSIREWSRECMRDFDESPAIDNHDQGTFTTSWEPYIALTGDSDALDWIRRYRDCIASHHCRRGAWRHGYWKRQEAHHGTEHFELFLSMLWRLAPADPETVRQFVDAAEHIGNWVRGIPAWFDWETGLFRSFFLGTELVDLTPEFTPNRPEHLRFITMALTAYEMTGEVHYLDLASVHGGRWAEAILQDERLPNALTHQGGVYSTDAKVTNVGQASCAPDNVSRLENFLASDAPNVFQKLHLATGDIRFRQVAERMLDILVGELADPDADAAVDAIRHYRNRYGDTRYDAAVLNAWGDREAIPITELSIKSTVNRKAKPVGLGKRSDMPLWYEDGRPRATGVALAALVAEIRKDASLATYAVDLARTYFELARAVYPHGRDHGCGSRSISAVARGHGRSNHAGMVTAVLVPIVGAFDHLSVSSLT